MTLASCGPHLQSWISRRAALARPWVITALVIPSFLLFASVRPAAAQICRGDCDGDGRVTVDELVIGVNIALGDVPFATCSSFDSNGDEAVTVDEIIAALGNAMNGCPLPVCTPPLCRTGEVFHCPDTCPGGCGTRCVTPTAPSVPTPTATDTPLPAPTPSFSATLAATPTPTTDACGAIGTCTPVPAWTPTRTPTCAPTGTPYCSNHCVPCPTVRPNCYRNACGYCIENPPCQGEEVQVCPGGFPYNGVSGCCGCATATPTPSAATPTYTPTPDCSRDPCPDLVPGAVTPFFPTPVGGCLASGQQMLPYYMDVCVANIGDAANRSFDVNVAYFDLFRVSGLQPNESHCERRSFRADGRLMVDYDAEVRESNELNNVTNFSLAVPSFPPTCTVAPDPTPSITASPTNTAGALPCATSEVINCGVGACGTSDCCCVTPTPSPSPTSTFVA